MLELWPLRPCFWNARVRDPFTPMGIKYTSDEAQVDFWLADTISQTLVISRTAPQVKRHTTYGRKIDVASVPDSKKYAIVAVVNVNGITTVCATEQFRTWTITQPQSSTITIETAIWSLLHVGVLDAREIFAEFDPVFYDFRFRIGYGETTDDNLDGILRLTFPDSRDTNPQTSVDVIAQTFHELHFYDVVTTYVQAASRRYSTSELEGMMAS